MSIAAGSLRELETQVQLARRPDLLRPADEPALSEQMDKVGRMLSRLTTSLRAK